MAREIYNTGENSVELRNLIAQQSYDALEHGIMAPKELKPQLLTAGEVYLLYGEDALDSTVPFAPVKPEADVEFNGHHEETDGYDDEETVALALSVLEGNDGASVSIELDHLSCSKNYKFFDAPQNRFPSDLLADLQDTMLPLDKPIQFERTASYAGKVERKKADIYTGFDKNGCTKVMKPYKGFTFHAPEDEKIRCYLHQEVVGFDIEDEDK